MRIRKIKFSNINNLKGGPHVVSFEEEPLASAGIFAITGPTGSGKSTLLDVITLALFNRIPRYDGKISDKKMQDLGSVITHHSKEAFAEVEYEVGGNRFTSKWSVHIAKQSGKIQPYEMAISDVSGNYLDIRRSDVPAKNEEIIGLDYEQFVKSIILSQGEFSKFLKSNVNERGKLLEKLTGGEVYRKISQVAYRKDKEIEQKLKFEKSLLAEIELLSIDKINELTTRISQSQSEIDSLEVLIKQSSAIYQIKTSLAKIKNQLAEKEANLAAANREELAFASKAEQCRVHEKVFTYNRPLTLHEKTLDLLHKNELEAAERKSELNLADQNFQKALKELSILTNSKVENENFLDILNQFEEKIVGLDYELANLKQKGTEEREKINQKLQTSNLNIDAKVQPSDAVQVLSEFEKNALKILSKSGFSENTPNVELKSLIKVNQEKIQSLRNWVQVKEIVEKDKENDEVLKLKIKESQQSLEKNEPLLQSNIELLTSLKNQAILLKNAREVALKIANLEAFRAELESGKPCPLCGSLEHPYTTHLPGDRKSEIEREIVKNDQDIASVEVKSRRLENLINTAKTSIKINEENQENLRSKIVENEKKIEHFKVQLADYQLYTLSELKKEIIDLEEYGNDLEKAMDAVERLKIVKELKIDFQQLVKLIASYAKIYGERQVLYKGEDIRTETNRLQDVYTRSQSLMKKLSELLLVNKKQKESLEKELKVIEKELLPAVNEFKVEDINSLKALLMDTSTYEKNKKEESLIQDKLKRLHTEQKHLLSEEAVLLEKDTLKSKSLELINDEIISNSKRRDELNAEIGAIKSMLKDNEIRKQKQAERQQEILVLEKENAKWGLLSKLIGSSSGDKFSNFAQGLTLQNLLAFTNRRLKNLTDRYRIDKPGPDGTLSVIDLYQGNTERAVTTLSGGEIFILSLALALSLSDMASRNVSLESLFIDEGFGTLDQETLDIAMTTLEKLQSESKKMVGIISHVEALKERINVQIQLKKNAQGYSHIEIVS